LSRPKAVPEAAISYSEIEHFPPKLDLDEGFQLALAVPDSSYVQ
jgi:hypothetical protein